jgi:hypothetical protein
VRVLCLYLTSPRSLYSVEANSKSIPQPTQKLVLPIIHTNKQVIVLGGRHANRRPKLALLAARAPTKYAHGNIYKAERQAYYIVPI